MKSIAAGFSWSQSRVSRSWWLRAAACCLVFTLLGLVLEHRAAPSVSRDNTLLTLTFGLILPLLAFTLSARVFPEGVLRTLAPLAQQGANRRAALLGSCAHIVLGTAALSALSAISSVVLGASAKAAGLTDALTCVWIGILGAFGYTAWFLLGSSIGRRGQGRWLFLALDWLFGSGISSLAAAWPRGHLRNLVGGLPVANLEQPAALLVLGLLALVYLSAALFRTPP
jgi:hypothetical protein